MHRFAGIYFLLILLALAACTEGETLPPAVAVEATLEPTPTLAPGLPTAPPPDPTAAGEMAPTATPLPTLTPVPTPTPTPLPAERVAMGEVELRNGNWPAVAEHLQISLNQPAALTDEQRQQSLFMLGLAYLQDGHFADAVATFHELRDLAAESAPSVLFFHLGQAQAELADYRAAIEAYQRYLEANPEMAAYVNPLLATAYLALGERDSAIAAYEAALSSPAHRLTLIENRQKLAEFYLADENYSAAIAQYDAIRELAVTENTQGQMNYLAGTAEILAGNTEAGYTRYVTGIADYPRAYESYLGLSALVEAGFAVDEFQRGLVDYYAGAYEPAVAAFRRYLEANPETYRPDTYLYLAWSYEGLGNVAAALAELDNYARTDPAEAAIERAKLQARAGDTAAAVAGYLAYLESFPEGSDAPFAAWWAAVLTERLGDTATAASRYRHLADTYPGYEEAPRALFRAGWLLNGSDDTEAALAVWQQLAQAYPDNEYGAAALVWLLRTLPVAAADAAAAPTAAPTASVEANQDPAEATVTATAEADPAELRRRVERWAAATRGTNYYALRVRDVVEGMEPFTANGLFEPPANPPDGQAEAETWLRRWLELESGTDVGSLSPELAGDNRLIVGEKLWQLGLLEMAKRELEWLRSDVAGSALSSYQLALYFGDLGLYRSSILAATSVLTLSGQTVFEAPRFIGRLAYPVYYDGLILPLADDYGYDPRLHFALVRQESLFESFARSGAAAQGLSQVIPDTGAYIAQRLDWPDYDNEDLYKPYVGLYFGAYYLSQQLGAFDGAVHAALAAYNAGPGNAARWYETAGDDHDLYLETVNFAETRLYIERIYEGFVIYRYLYGE